MEKNKFNRRGFLKSSIIGATGLVVGQKAFAGSSDNVTTGSKNDQKIVYRTLGRTGLKLPIVSMGDMRADNPNLVRAALNKGIKHLDTAHGYQSGRNEEMLGEVLKDYPRDSYTIATKVKQVGMDRRTGNYSEEATEEKFMEMFDLSIERLGLYYVEILYHQSVSTKEGTLHEPTLIAMKKIKKSGRAKFLGLSTHSNEPEVIDAAIESGVYDVVLTSYNFNQDHVDKMNVAIEKAGKAGLGIVAMKPMAGGFFDREKQHPVNTKAALKWVLSNPNVGTSIPGFTAFDHLEDSFSIMENPELTEEEKKDLEGGASIASLYCDGCKNCLEQCPENLPIPDIMRAYMYTYGYGETEKAHNLLASLELPENPCSDCSSCSVKCTKRFAIAQKIKDVNRLRTVPGDFLT